MKFLAYLSLVLFLFTTSCSSDDDAAIENEDPNDNGEEELIFDFESSDRSFGNAYISLEDNQSGVDFYRLQIVPPGVTFDSSSGVFSGGSTGDYVSFDFKVPESEAFLSSGDYEINYQASAYTVEGVLYENVTINLDGADAIPMVLTVPDSEGINLQIDESSFTISVDAMAMKASASGTEDVEVKGVYSSDYEFIDLE